jgi:hypothetical protein
VAREVAEDQWGLLTRTQALAAGVPRATFARLVSARALIRVAHGVYRIAGGPDPGHLELRAAWLHDRDVIDGLPVTKPHRIVADLLAARRPARPNRENALRSSAP